MSSLALPHELKTFLGTLVSWVRQPQHFVIIVSMLLSIAATTYFFHSDTLVGYGDAESHLNISKRVVSSLTPGLAQLGGIWLPLPHLLMVPFVAFDTLWYTGIAGAIVSGAAYVISTAILFRFVREITNSVRAGVAAAAAFALNPNILYLQSTAMTEVLLIAFFLLSSFYFYRYLLNEDDLLALIYAAFFGFCATLTRYDGWFLVLVQAAIIGLMFGRRLLTRAGLQAAEGKLVLFSTLAFFGIGLWLLWDWLILGDPLYFTSSPFSAKSQQQAWMSRGELPAYQDLWQSVLYYSVTAWENVGAVVSVASSIGLLLFLLQKGLWRWYLTAVLFVPFVFYVVTLYMGQSIIFIPTLTPESFEWQLFNVRYGVMMVPVAAFFFGFLMHRLRVLPVQLVAVAMLAVQLGVFGFGVQQVISYEDGVRGLSANPRSDAEHWLRENYDGGNILIDDFARTVSVIRSKLPMDRVIYIGTKPYWEESLVYPERHAEWIVMQEDDTVWEHLYVDEVKRGHVFTYYELAYTSPKVLVFKRMEGVEEKQSLVRKKINESLK